MLGPEQTWAFCGSGEAINKEEGYLEMKRIVSLAMGLLVLSGCAMQSDLIDLENEVRKIKGIVMETQRDVATLQKAQQSGQQEQVVEQMKKEVGKLGGELRETLDVLQKNQADFEIRFNQLATDVQVIQGNLEENSHRLSELTSSLDDQEAALQELSRRIDALESRTGQVQKGEGMIILPGREVESGKVEGPSRSDTSPVPPPSQPLSRIPAPSESTAAAARTLSPSELYNRAYKDYLAGNHDLAISGFTDYLRQSPAGNLAPNALYWIGESYYSKGDYSKAITAFESVTIDYPKSEKIAGALLKIGYAYEKMGNKDMAVVYLKKVVEQFPYSEEARLAKVKLTELK